MKLSITVIGQTECADRTLEAMLRQYLSLKYDHDDWDDHLAMADFAVNDAW